MTRRLPCLPLLFALASACHNPAGPTVAPGTYALVSVDGAALPSPNRSHLENGTVELSPFGHAHRRVTYRFSPHPLVHEASGSYRVTGTTIELTLVESGGYVWRVHGTIEGASITLRYPHPADGETAERYER